MTRRTLARQLAVRLAVGSWDKHSIERALRQRLPPALHRLVPDMTAALLVAHTSRLAPDEKAVANALSDTDAFRRVYHYCQRRNVWPDPDLNCPQMSPIDAFAHLDVPKLVTNKDLADWLMLPVAMLDAIADPPSRHEAHGEMAINHYHYHLLRKASGTPRLIEAPKPRLKQVQHKIMAHVLHQVPPHPDAFGFVIGRNCLQAAQRHVSEEVVVCFDLASFFATVGFGRVLGVFRSLGYPPKVARMLAHLCTTRTPDRLTARLPPQDRTLFGQIHLPQGAPTSPIMSNLIAYRLDCRLAGLARSLDAHYSRYADDMTFSGDATIVRPLLRALPGIIRSEGFVLNGDKTRAQRQTTRQTVTGTVVNSHLNLPRKTFDRIKAAIHACNKTAPDRVSDLRFRAALEGQINWACQINPSRGSKLAALYQRALSGK